MKSDSAMYNSVAADSAESRFLRAREMRDAQRRAERENAASVEINAAAQLLLEARKQLAELVTSSGKIHDELLAPYLAEAAAGSAAPPVAPGSVVAQAMQQWRNLQEGVQRILNGVKLPAHDVQQANSALAKRLQAIEAARLGRGAAAALFSNNGDEQPQQQQQGAAGGAGRRFRFRRLENYNGEIPSSPNDAATNGGASPNETGGSASSKNRLYDSSGASAVGEANAIQGLEPDATYVIVAKQAAFIRLVQRCRLFLPPVSGSVFLAGLQDCTVYVACRQLRMKDCARCTVFVCAASTPVIEDSVGIRFGGYAAWRSAVGAPSADMLQRLGWAMMGAGADEAAVRKRLSQSYRAVDDFTWLRSTPSPHFTVSAEEADWADMVVDDVPLPPRDAPEACTKLS